MDSIDQMDMADEVVSILYPASLYAIQEGMATETPAGKKPVSKKYIVITREALNPEIPDQTFTFLIGILNACKLDLRQVELASPGTHPMNYAALQQAYDCSMILLFGVTPAEIRLPVYFPHFQHQSFAGVSYIASPDLPELENDKILKSKLWLCLKQAFSL